MKCRNLGVVALGVFAVAACSSAGEGGDANFESTAEPIIGPSVLGGRNEVVMLYARVLLPTGQIATRTCSGAYFAPRVVATAAHCLPDVIPGQLFVYYGDNFAADLGQLVEGPNGLEPPAPGQASFWARADSFESYPSYDPTQHYPDLGVVYLDRKLPFDPLPLSRTPLAANRVVTISGWGANSAPTPTTGAGGQVQRTGTTHTLGSPKASDYHPEDPNPGLLVAANRANQIKLDGTPPNANVCFGDSGSPVLVNDSGQTYIAGINYFTGLSCADYGLAVRIDPFLPFFDQAYQKGGQAPLKPSFDCVATNAQGTLSAFFGYQNQNGVSVAVPYGTKNSLAADSTSQRPKQFLPGDHHYSFVVDFAANQTLTWTLAPDNSPTTTLKVNASSRRCGAADAQQSECALSCRASQRSGCANLPTFEQCVSTCLDQASGFASPPLCAQRISEFDVCTAGVSPAPANWDCIDGFGAFALTPCAAQIDALNSCFE